MAYLHMHAYPKYTKKMIDDFLDIALLTTVFLIFIEIAQHIEDSYELTLGYLCWCIMVVILSIDLKKRRKGYKREVHPKKLGKKMKILESLKQKWVLACLYAATFVKDKEAISTTQKVVELSITLIVFAVIGVTAISYIFAANTSGWDENVVTLFHMIPIFFVLAICLSIIYTVVSRR